MCGILGTVDLPLTQPMLDSIGHRGPDRQDKIEKRCGRHEVRMGHARLSIVDLSENGNQPMVSPCGNYVLVYNGEIYNHTELRRLCKFDDWHGHSDTETLLHLLMEKGEDCLPLLNGIFAFAFLDLRKGTMLLMRDFFGVKPLYYAISDNSLVFASELRPIRMGMATELDMDALQMLLRLRYVPSPYTLMKGVSKLLPGHKMTIDLTKERLEWDIAPVKMTRRKYDVHSFEEEVEIYGQKLTEAVERQLMGDVDMGVLLSGGVDSALVAGIAAKAMGRNVKAFTVGFDEECAENEIVKAAETARHFGMEHYVAKMNAGNFFDTFAECCRIVEEPLATTSTIPMYYLAKLASQHVKVVLTGQGADEPLGGYRRYQGELIRRNLPNMVFPLMSKVLNIGGIKNEALIRGVHSLGIKDDVERFDEVYATFTKQEIERLVGCKYNDRAKEQIAYYYDKTKAQKQSTVEHMMAIDKCMDLADDLLLYTDKITMNFALECRVPMLDTQLVGYLEALPENYKLKLRKTKIIHKALAQRYLPEHIVNRPKLGFQSPTKVWFRQSSDFIEQTLKRGAISTVLSSKEMVNIVAQHKAGYNREKQIFLLLSINEWMKDMK